jgi:molybdenum cofactor cytidylyltransferase
VSSSRRNSPSIGCAILAAGAGTRFSSRASKLAFRIAGRPLLQHAIDTACASPALTCTLVLGARADEIAACVDARRCATVINPAWNEGIAASIRCAIDEQSESDGCIVMLGDQPHVTAGDLAALIAAHAGRRRSIVALRRGRLWGAPVLFPRGDFERLLTLQGDRGAKAYARSQSSRLTFVEAERADAFADVDVRRDVHRHRSRSSGAD